MNKRIINKNFRNTGTNRRRRGFRQGLFTGAAAAVVFITVYSLILPAITMERYACGLEEHQHSVDCYTDGILACGMTEHRHTDACRGEGTSDEKSLFADMSAVTSAVTSADTSTGSSTVTPANTPADASADTSEEAFVVTPADTYADTSAAPSGGQVFFSNEEEADSNSSVFGFGDSSALQETGGELQDTDGEINTETGKAEVSDNGVTISAADGSYLPEEAEASAQILREADADAVAARVEESNGTATTGAKESNGTAMTGAEESNGIPAASPKAKNAAPAAKLKAANAAPAARRKAGTAATAAAENSAPAGSVSGSDASSAETSPAAGGSAESGSAANSSAGQMSASTKYKVFDIRLEGVDETAYADGFRVDVQLQESLTGRDFRLYHIHEGEAPLDITKTLELHFDESGAYGAAESGTDTEKRITGFSFVTDNFSEFVLSYTVDFHYEVNGQTYEFSLPGGGFVSLTNLLEMLGIAGDTDAARKLVADVVSAEFSNPDLVWVGRADAETTVGSLKEANQLVCQYSAELTDEQIAEINAQTVEAGDWALISMQPFTSEEKLTVTMKNGDAFTIRVTDAQITTLFLSDSGELFEVTVTYDDAANIPDGSTLQVTEFAEDDERFEYARNAVLADKKARGEWVDLNRFGLAALDISILNPAGEEIEPEAPVQVDIRIKELPGVEDLNEVANTLAIQHHVEVEDGVVVETVFDGSAEALDENADASFELETDETVAEEGIAVDPEAVREEEFDAQGKSTSSTGDDADDDDIGVSFETPVFSTFTVTWGSSSEGDSTTNLRFRYDNTNMASITVHYIDENGYAISRPNEIGNNVDRNIGWQQNTNVNIQDALAKTINGYTYKGAFRDSAKTKPISSIRGYLTSQYGYYYRYIYFSNGTTNVETNESYYENAGDIYLIYESDGSTSEPHTTIHHGYMEGNDFVEFDEQPEPVSVDMSHHVYLIYDFDGYQYAGKTYYRSTEAVNGANMTSGATSIQARLRYRNNKWQYRSNSWSDVADGSHIYVVYDKKKDAEQGGTPTIKQSAEYKPPAAPTITKESTVNGDGTNTLSLSVSGHTANMEVEKLADVIVVFDVSGSMSTSDMSGDTRLKAGRDSINSLAHVLLNKTNSFGDNLIRMGLVTFSTDAQVVQALTDDESTFKAAVNRQTTASGGTNWEKALMLANQMEVDSGRATFVIFVTDGDPTFRISRQGETDADLDMYGKDGNDDYYVSNCVFGEGDDDSRKNNYNAAKVQAESIIEHRKTLYTIAISSDATHLNEFADDVGAAGKYTATSTAQLSQAFNDIASSIIALMGHSDVKITDGITALTQTVQKSELVSFAEDDFIYSKKRLATQEEISDRTKVPVGAEIENSEGTFYVVWNNWDPASEGCATAVYDSDSGAVKWNMGEGFMLEDGYTYQVRFKVWPSQKAYDLLADLNNGKKSYDDLTEEEKAQIKEPTTAGGMYTLKTNSDTSYTYREATKSGDTVTPTGEPSKPGTFPDVDPLELTTKPLKVMKQWHNNYVDSRALTDHITMDFMALILTASHHMILRRSR